MELIELHILTRNVFLMKYIDRTKLSNVMHHGTTELYIILTDLSLTMSRRRRSVTLGSPAKSAASYFTLSANGVILMLTSINPKYNCLVWLLKSRLYRSFIERFLSRIWFMSINENYPAWFKKKNAWHSKWAYEHITFFKIKNIIDVLAILLQAF